jgi:toxin-antitoxin system PIN domain toxin
MLSIDTNILLYALAEDCPEHRSARQFLESLQTRADVLLSEFVLVELYRLVRNPAVAASPLTAAAAAGVVAAYRRHPRWRVAGFTTESRRLHDQLWRLAAQPGFAFRRIFDARLALVLLHHGVTEFATANERDFAGFGFERVWNPLG